MNRISVGLTLLAALVALGIVLAAGQAFLQPDLPLITQAGFTPDTISPNADGVDDVAEFAYTLSGNADISLRLVSEDGAEYFFRQNQPRIPGEHRVLFSGVVDGFTLPGETISGNVLRRLIPDGRYTWHLQAANAQTGETGEISGTLVIEGGDAALPELQNFSVISDVFTPNQDGINDRTQITVYLPKAADLSVYLVGADGEQIYIPEFKQGRELGEEGRHLFDYDGGVDLGVEPPPDGTYTLVALAQDAVGQQVRQTATLTVQNGGDPLAEIVPQSTGPDVIFTTRPYDERYFSTMAQSGMLIDPPDNPEDFSLSAITLPVGDLLVFQLTVENYGDVPIRTSGPPPGTVYEQDQVAASLGWLDQSGAWRVGLHCETATLDFPWRWAIGSAADLVAEQDFSGNTYYYLPPGKRSVVWGAVRMTDLNPRRNPQNCWAGLIHEDVRVDVRNARVGARNVELVNPSATPEG